MTFYSLPSDYRMWKKNTQTVIVLLVLRRKTGPKYPVSDLLNSNAESKSARNFTSKTLTRSEGALFKLMGKCRHTSY